LQLYNVKRIAVRKSPKPIVFVLHIMIRCAVAMETPIAMPAMQNVMEFSNTPAERANNTNACSTMVNAGKT
jgi:hypothetical protein